MQTRHPVAKCPNLLFLFPDQFRLAALGEASGLPHADPVQVPNLVRLAANGRVLTHAISNFPVSSPFRGMLMTARYPFRNGVHGNCNLAHAAQGIGLPERLPCFSDVLHEAGYHCGYIGKWHLDAPSLSQLPHTEGFRPDAAGGGLWDAYTPPGPRRHHFDFWHAYGCCDRHLKPHYWVGEAALDERLDVDGWSSRHEADVAIDYLLNRHGERDADKPFALFVAFNPPHTPFEEVPPEYLAPYENLGSQQLLGRGNVPAAVADKLASEARQYFAAVSGVDAQVGRILAALAQSGEADNTLVVFTSDHGEMLGSHGLMHKKVWYDEALRIPFILHWPGKIPPGQDDLLLSVPDIQPTLLALLGVPVAQSVRAGWQGQDYSRQLLGLGGERPDAALYYRIEPSSPQFGQRGLRTRRYSYVLERSAGGERQWLFDLQADPWQLRNLAAAEPDLCRVLAWRMWQMLDEAGDVWQASDSVVLRAG